jgi:hypothetical protein
MRTRKEARKKHDLAGNRAHMVIIFRYRARFIRLSGYNGGEQLEAVVRRACFPLAAGPP